MVDNGNAPIVVGVDGSEAARAGLDWAAAEAARRGCALHAVAVSEHANQEALAQVDAISARYPSVRSRYVRMTGAPGPALVEAAREAAMLVVGSRGHGRLASALLGSVSAYCTAHAECPVLVVPDPHRAVESEVDALATPGPLL